MNLNRFTRRLDECRKRWHRRTLQYVLEVARIVRAARIAAKNERRWGEWIRHEIHMNRTTVYRYLRVAKFLRANVDSKHQLVSLSIAKIYALSRLKVDRARALIKERKPERMSDLSFLKFARRLQPHSMPRIILPNLFKSLSSAFVRLEHSMRRWQHSEINMPVGVQLKFQSKIQAISRILDRIRKRTSAAAM
jgi:hypothetical protein